MKELTDNGFVGCDLDVVGEGEPVDGVDVPVL